jgi:hypothetical protein
MPHPFPILTTRLITQSVDLAKDALSLDCIGVIHGVNGTGKTEALKAVHSRFPSVCKDGISILHRACAVSGPTRGVKDLLIEVGLKGGHVSSMSLQLACKLALREFSNKNVRLLLVDEADAMAKDSLGGLITLVDYCNQHGQRIALVMTAAHDISSWFSGQRAGMSRTVRFVQSTHLSIEETLSIIVEWVPELSELIRKAQNDDPSSLKLTRLIYKGTAEGNLRRLSYFCGLLKSDNSFSPKDILSVIDRISFEK